MWCSYHARTSPYRGRGPKAIAHGFGVAAVCWWSWPLRSEAPSRDVMG